MNEDRTMNDTRDTNRNERGSALIIAILITVIMSLLGISYLLMAQTESTIAENERNGAMALYVAEAGARVAVNWFNDPSTTTGYLVPTTGQVTRTVRLLDTDNNPATARVLGTSGDLTKPLYKDAAATLSPLFDRPYRSALGETFLGIETGTDPDSANATKGPDIVVNQSHLDTINAALFGVFPAPTLRARIQRIEIYAPPIVSIGGAATRMGIATVKVIGGVVLYPGTAEERQIATRVVKAVVNELPLPGPSGPLQSCGSVDIGGSLDIYWGTATSAAGFSYNTGALNNKAPTGIPYANNDPYSYYNSGGNTLATWAAAHPGESMEDPWYRAIAGGAVDVGGASEPQPLKFLTGPPSVPWPGEIDKDHSNIFQNTPSNCPIFDYNQWKAIAQSGVKNTYYFKHSSGVNFLLDGVGTAQSFETWTTGRTGVMFFDTANGRDPNNGGGGSLSPAISAGSSWNSEGVMYLNAVDFSTTGNNGSGTSKFIVPPGEPGDATGFVNIDYPNGFGPGYQISSVAESYRVLNTTTGEWWCTDYTNNADCQTGAGANTIVKDTYGRPFYADVAWSGVFYTNGTVQFHGNAQYYGSLVAQGNVSASAGTPQFFFDERIIKGNWPPKEMKLPRVVISSWQTDL